MSTEIDKSFCYTLGNPVPLLPVKTILLLLWPIRDVVALLIGIN